LGARPNNQAALAASADAPSRVLHIAGRRDFGDLAAPSDRYDLRDYVTPFGNALAAADLCVARSGGSIFELAQYGLPAVLVPYPHASADHQTTNARWMESAGAAVVIPDAELTAQRLARCVAELVADRARLGQMAAASRRLARPDAALDVARELLASSKCPTP
ncbi:MAG: UDP-N-acetylglucosamine--N-acetylmuramyl-(pentapeptide) pyrophosphoryl-undecaprenol, partial [Solirubrobacteraceae bacterium]|nr:UDP-N-acetylglucosamine--N-acetylmuramyl-(pentapeptide) pyrophosphoryl-undecaprenol [Solirubrobacteraceae bacterium]